MADPSPQFRFNGVDHGWDAERPTESLLHWLKRHQHTGTKEGCADGDCGACTVALLESDHAGRRAYRAVNSCLLPMGALAGREVVTVEALSGPQEALHPVQQAMVQSAGSQCGYCTPGFVMSLFAAYYTREWDDAVIEGNLCRCTGYAPIRNAMAQLAQLPEPDDRFQRQLAGSAALSTAMHGAAFFNPGSVSEALQLKARHPEAEWVAGATDLAVGWGHGTPPARAYIALDRVAELKIFEKTAQAAWLGAGLNLNELARAARGLFPALDQMLPWFAANQVRNRATLGGNLGSASPIGDLLPVLLALDARVHCVGPRGSRALPIDGFFLDYRKTARASDELITAVEVPLDAACTSASYKVAKRQSDDISIVAASFALKRDTDGTVQRARLAYGGVAAVPARAQAAERYLVGRRLDDSTLQGALGLLRNEFKPISDHRAGATYRSDLCANLFHKFVLEHAT